MPSATPLCIYEYLVLNSIKTTIPFGFRRIDIVGCKSVIAVAASAKRVRSFFCFLKMSSATPLLEQKIQHFPSFVDTHIIDKVGCKSFVQSVSCLKPTIIHTSDSSPIPT